MCRNKVNANSLTQKEPTLAYGRVRWRGEIGEGEGEGEGERTGHGRRTRPWL